MSAAQVLNKKGGLRRNAKTVQVTSGKPSPNDPTDETPDTHKEVLPAVSGTRSLRTLVWTLVALVFVGCVLYIWRMSTSIPNPSASSLPMGSIHSSSPTIQASEAQLKATAATNGSNKQGHEDVAISLDKPDAAQDDALFADLPENAYISLDPHNVNVEKVFPTNYSLFNVQPPKVTLQATLSRPNFPWRGASGFAATLLDLNRLPASAVPIHIAKLHNWAFHGWLQNLQAQRLDPAGGYTVIHFDTHSDMFGTGIHGGSIRASGVSRIARSDKFVPTPGLNTPSNADSPNHVPGLAIPSLSQDAYLVAKAAVEGASSFDSLSEPIAANKLTYIQITQMTRLLTIANYIPAGIFLGSDVNYNLTTPDGTTKESKSGHFIDHVIWVRPEVDSELNNPAEHGDWNITIGFMHLLERDVPMDHPRYGLPRNVTLAQFLSSQLVDGEMMSGMSGIVAVLNKTEDPFAGNEWRPAFRINEYVSKVAYRYDGLVCCTARGIIDAAFCNSFEEPRNAFFNESNRGIDGRISSGGNPVGSRRPIFGLDALKSDEELEAERIAAMDPQSSLAQAAKDEKSSYLQQVGATSEEPNTTPFTFSPWSSYLEGLAQPQRKTRLPVYPTRTFRLTVVNPRQFIRMVDPDNAYVKVMDEHANMAFLSHQEREDPAKIREVKERTRREQEKLALSPSLPRLTLKPGSVLLDIDLDYFASTSEVHGMAIAEGIDDDSVSFAAETVRACCGHRTRFSSRNSGCCAYLPHRAKYVRSLLAELLGRTLPRHREFRALLREFVDLTNTWSEELLNRSADKNKLSPDHLQVPLQCPELDSLTQNVTSKFSKYLTNEMDRMFLWTVFRPSDGEVLSLEPTYDSPIQRKLASVESELASYVHAYQSGDLDEEDDDYESEEDSHGSEYQYDDDREHPRRRKMLSVETHHDIPHPVQSRLKLEQHLHADSSETETSQPPFNARIIAANTTSVNKPRRYKYSLSERRRRTRERVRSILKEFELVRTLHKEAGSKTEGTDTNMRLTPPKSVVESVAAAPETPESLSLSAQSADMFGTGPSPLGRKPLAFDTALTKPAFEYVFRSISKNATESSATTRRVYRRRHHGHSSKRNSNRKRAPNVKSLAARLSEVDADTSQERTRFNPEITEQFSEEETYREDAENADVFCRIVEYSEHLPTTFPLPNSRGEVSRITGRRYYATYATQYLLRATRGLREALKFIAPATRVVTIARSNDVFLPPALTQEVEWLVLSALHDSGLGLLQVVDADSNSGGFVRLVQHDHSQVPSARPEGMCTYKFPFCVDFSKDDDDLFWESPYYHNGIGGHGAEVRRRLRSRANPTSPATQDGDPVYFY